MAVTLHCTLAHRSSWQTPSRVDCDGGSESALCDGRCFKRRSFSIDPEAALVEASGPEVRDKDPPVCLFAAGVPRGLFSEVGQAGWDAGSRGIDCSSSKSVFGSRGATGPSETTIFT